MNIKKDLNPQQIAAVEQLEGPCMIVAGAGSGKTRVLTYKIAYLIDSGISPHEILALTFTNKAANEMKERIFKLVGKSAGYIWMGTFHSIFARILRMDSKYIGFDRNFSIYDDGDSKKLTEDIMKELNINPENIRAEAIRATISNLKNKLILHEDYISMVNNPFEKTVSRVYTEYQSRLFKNNAMDFDDLLINPILLFLSNNDVLTKYQNRYKFILVDEYQDTNRAQYKLIKMLSGGHGNITVVGDDAQSIYRWRGAEIENILSFAKDFKNCNIFKLEQNYRSTKKILAFADEVIKNNKRQIHKTLFTNNHEGDEVVLWEVFTDRDESAMIIKWIMDEIHKLKLNFKDFVILYRTNAQSRVLEEALRTNSIPYVIVGGVKFYQRKEIKDVLAYLKLLVNNRDDEATARVLKLCDGIGEQTIDKLKRYGKDNNLTLCEALFEIVKNRAEFIRAGRIAGELSRLAAIIEKYRHVKEELSPGELARSLIDELGIIRAYRNQGTEDALERMYNVQELLSGITEYADKTENPSLEGFLQEVSLLTDIDTYDDKKNAVTLMTMHAAKGLEYPVVFITGLEEGLFPLTSSTLTLEELEEERRLFYVAITRGMKKVYMTYALQRYRFGSMSYQMKSRFLNEINLDKLNYNKQSVHLKKRIVQEEGSSIRYEYYNSAADTDEDIFDPNSKLKKGSIVYHNNFGKGKVLELSGKGDNRKAQIKFDKAGIKNIILKYANLKIH